MAVYKCKMCGGSLEINEGMTVCECEYCGSVQTVPQLDDEKKINLFTRANRLRSACEFDKASGVYESIIADFPAEAEAYWGLILCKYGIEYVDDPKTGKKIPTCHRSSFDSVMDDQNFEMVMECSDVTSRSVYRDEAKTIEKLRVGILEVSSKEEPYDIFICYKETDAMGERTIDSVIAQDVYDALTEKGYKVFFSRITLEDKLGQEYEPYIFAALNSSKVMLVFGTDYEYYNAVWVKNEWRRYLNLIEKGAKKTLIPCYKGIDAYDMPKEFAKLQAQDMGKVGAIQDLLRGISKILGAQSQNTVNTSAAGTETASLIQRGNMALEDGDFGKADTFFERALDANPSAAQAYLGKFLAGFGLKSLNDLGDKFCQIEGNKEFMRAEQFADSSLAQELQMVKESNERKIQAYRLSDVIRKETEKKAEREVLQLIAQCNEVDYQKAIALYDAIYENRLIDYNKYSKNKLFAKNRYVILKYLRENLETLSLEKIGNAVRSAGLSFRMDVLSGLVARGYVKELYNGYCWPEINKERERQEKEAEERRQKEIKQKAAFDEACERINRQISSEIESVKATIDEEYAPMFLEIQKIIDSEVAENNRQIDEIKRHISDLRSQQSSLGLFKVKEKKVFQTQINEAQEQLNRLASQSDIQARYQPQISRINDEKAAKLESITAEIKAKYPLPSIKDFQV